MDPHVAKLIAELDAVIEGHVAGQPRSQQKRIGPSEMGHPCDLRIGYRLLGHPQTNKNQPLPWKPWIGTRVHEGLEEVFAHANMAQPNWSVDGEDRYRLEERVAVGRVGQNTITGVCDFFHNGVVIDWKIVGANALRRYKTAQDPGEQYRTQVHLYGLGWENAGHTVTHVAIYFLPRDQEWKQRYIWAEPYDRQIALNAIERADAIAQLVNKGGTAALGLLRRHGSYCQSCPWFKANSKDLTRGCPGDPAMLEAAMEPFADLIARQPNN